jgi:hypothetical protein
MRALASTAPESRRRFRWKVVLVLSVLTLGYGVRATVDALTFTSPLDLRPIHLLPQRPFDHSAWCASFPDESSRVELRRSMRDSVLARFGPGAKLNAVIKALGMPDQLDVLDSPAGQLLQDRFGKSGTVLLGYTVDFWDDSFVPTRYDPVPVELFLVFDDEGSMTSRPALR